MRSEPTDDIGPSAPLQVERRFIARALLLCVVFSLGFNLLMLATPIYMMQVFDRVLSTRNEVTLGVLTIIAVFAILAMSMLDDARTRVLFHVGGGLERHLTPLVLRRGFSQPSVGDVPGQSLRDLGVLRNFLGSPSVLPFLDAPWAPLFLAVIYLIHPLLGHLTLLGGVVLLGLALWNNAATRATTATGNILSTAVTREVDLASRHADTVRAMGLLDALLARWRRGMGEAGEALERGASRASLLTASSKFVRMSLQVGVMGTGAYLVIKGEMSPGAMLAGSILLARALAPAEQAIGSWRAFTAAQEAWRNTRQLLMAPLPVISDMTMPAPTGRLTVRDLTHVPAPGLQPVLQRVSFTLEPGQSIGIAGPTGAGKSTLARLISGASKPTAGEVRLDGVEMATWADLQRGPHVGYLPQEIDLFEATIRANIARMGEPDDGAVVEAARKAGVHEMILALPDGYETVLGPKGVRLSGGQKQRIGLARALYGNPVLIVLDEPSSSLDLAGETALVKAVRDACARGAVVVLIEHRPRIFRCVDQVLLLDAGIPRELGSTAAMMAKLAKPADNVVPPTPTTEL